MGASRILESDAVASSFTFRGRARFQLSGLGPAGVFGGRGRRTPLSSIAEWRWVPRPAASVRADLSKGVRVRLLAALRAGHSLGTGFEIQVGGGALPEVTLACDTPAAARWITRVLLLAYGRSTWIRRPPVSAGGDRTLEWGRRVRPWPVALREAGDGPSAIAQLALALCGLPGAVSVRWRFRPCPATWSRNIWEDRTPPAPIPTVERFSPRRASGGIRSNPVPSPVDVPLFWRTTVVLGLPAYLERDRVRRSAVRSAVEHALRTGQMNGVRFSPRRTALPWNEPWFPLTEEELACVLPSAESDSPILPVSPPSDGSILPLGRSVTGHVIGPSIETDQGRHIAVLGETGMGKSATLVAIARQAVPLGGVVLLDPLGETARSFVRGLTRSEELGRLIWVSPEGTTGGINALEGVGGRDADPVLSDRRLNDLVHALRRVRSGRYTEKYWGPRLEEMVTRALSAASSFPGGTLAEAHTLLATGGRTRRVIPPEAQDAVRELADRVRERPEDAEGARRLLYEVVRSPVLRRMLCEPDPHLHTRELVTPGRIAVISGDASRVGESVARYLLAVYLALVWSELLARPGRPKTFVLLDESQWFSHDSLAEMLRLARRRNVHVVLATQTVGSLPEGVEEAVWTNVSDFVAFRGSPEEARELERATVGVSVEEILALPRGHAAVLLGKGNSVAWMRTAGRPPDANDLDLRPPPPAKSPPSEGVPLTSTSEVLRERSETSADDVLDWIRDRARVDPTGSPLTIPLEELRRSVDPAGRAIRAAGAALGRAGALLSSDRGESGAVWTVDPARIPVGRDSPVRPLGTGSAEAPQQY